MSGHFNNASYAGMHLIVDLWGSNPDILKDSDAVRTSLIRAAKKAGATILADNFHYFGDECGVTGVVVLSESHISIHTWPEECYAAVDIFMCGNCDPRDAVKVIVDALEATDYDTNLLFRGVRKVQTHPAAIAIPNPAQEVLTDLFPRKKSATV